MRTPAPLLLFLAAACSSPAGVRPAAAPIPPPWEAENPLRPLPAVPLGSPADFSRAPWVTPEKVRLGRWLFFDGRLSSDGAVSCATCHDPARAFSEERPVSTGVHGLRGRRKSPPIVNAAFPATGHWFWDGRATSLVEQAKGPIVDRVEMGSSAAAATAAIAAVPGYAPHFREAFGDPAVTFDRIAEAIAAYEATRLSGNSRNDRHDAGDPTALDPDELRGKQLFLGKAACARCHLGPNLSDGRFHNLGVGWAGEPDDGPAMDGFADKGRYEVTRDRRDVGAFKTPSLRDVSRRAPYMHDGSLPTLREAVAHYQPGGTANPWLSEIVRPVRLTCDEVDAITAFLRALDGEGFADDPPRTFPR